METTLRLPNIALEQTIRVGDGDADSEGLCHFSASC